MTTIEATPRTASKAKPAKPRPSEFQSRDERLAAGKALRENLPRERHAIWKASAKRRDPIDVLEESNRDRLPELVPIRYGLMLRSGLRGPDGSRPRGARRGGEVRTHQGAGGGRSLSRTRVRQKARGAECKRAGAFAPRVSQGGINGCDSYSQRR